MFPLRQHGPSPHWIVDKPKTPGWSSAMFSVSGISQSFTSGARSEDACHRTSLHGRAD
jgi:hypothetical protein